MTNADFIIFIFCFLLINHAARAPILQKWFVNAHKISPVLG